MMSAPNAIIEETMMNAKKRANSFCRFISAYRVPWHFFLLVSPISPSG